MLVWWKSRSHTHAMSNSNTQQMATAMSAGGRTPDEQKLLPLTVMIKDNVLSFLNNGKVLAFLDLFYPIRIL